MWTIITVASSDSALQFYEVNGFASEQDALAAQVRLDALNNWPRLRLKSVCLNKGEPSAGGAVSSTLDRAASPPMQDYPDPTPADLADPQFEAVWQAIKGWDIRRDPESLYAACRTCTGNDVMHILNALRATPATSPAAIPTDEVPLDVRISLAWTWLCAQLGDTEAESPNWLKNRLFMERSTSFKTVVLIDILRHTATSKLCAEFRYSGRDSNGNYVTCFLTVEEFANNYELVAVGHGAARSKEVLNALKGFPTVEDFANNYEPIPPRSAAPDLGERDPSYDSYDPNRGAFYDPNRKII